MRIPRLIVRTLPVAAALVAAGCASHGGSGHHGMAAGGHAMAGGSPAHAVASLGPTQGQQVRGLVMFHEDGRGGLRVHARVSGLKPNGEHGFHIHEKGDCASPDATSAGGHFNPDSQPHGPQGSAHHAGDLPSLKADANGQAELHVTVQGPTLGSGPRSVVTRSVVVHAGPDDFSSQPAGNAGARIACGVIAAHH